MRTILRAAAILLLVNATLGAAQRVPKAEDVVKAAKQKAAEQNKGVFLVFGASWCEDCHELDGFLAVPEMAEIFDKYFVVTKLAIGEAFEGHPERDNAGSEFFLMKYGGVSPSGEVEIPFIAILDAKAKLVVNSHKTGKGKSTGGGTGFPTEPEDIQWFLGMLQKGAPAMTDDERHRIQETLQRSAAE
jgi:thiol-disulfide isomerase/thioredoxin